MFSNSFSAFQIYKYWPNFAYIGRTFQSLLLKSFRTEFKAVSKTSSEAESSPSLLLLSIKKEGQKLDSKHTFWL